MTSATDTLILEAARAAMARAHCPYSSFAVGAAILDEAGRIHVGCNIENAAFASTQCAEAGALAAAVAAGGQRFTRVAIVTIDGSAPCGNCRQMLMELAPDAEILLARADALGEPRNTSVKALLPDPFLAAALPPRS